MTRRLQHHSWGRLFTICRLMVWERSARFLTLMRPLCLEDVLPRLGQWVASWKRGKRLQCTVYPPRNKIGKQTARTLRSAEAVPPALFLGHYVEVGLGAGGCSARALISDWNPTLLCAPSQKGLFSECPQRQRLIEVRPPRSKTPPSESTISKSPSIRTEPLLRTVIFVAAKSSSEIELIQNCKD